MLAKEISMVKEFSKVDALEHLLVSYNAFKELGLEDVNLFSIDTVNKAENFIELLNSYLKKTTDLNSLEYTKINIGRMNGFLDECFSEIYTCGKTSVISPKKFYQSIVGFFLGDIDNYENIESTISKSKSPDNLRELLMLPKQKMIIKK